MAHRFFDGLAPTLLIAHRGGAASSPENTPSAFRRAREHRCDMLEIDVHATRDGRIVVAHDTTVDRCTDGAGAIADMTYDEIARLDAGHRFTPDGGRTFPFRGTGVCVPLLSDVLQEFSTTRFNIEQKPEGGEVTELVAAVVRGAGAIDRVCVGSEHDAVGERLRAALPGACHFFPRQALTAFVMALLGGKPPPPSPFDVLDMPLSHDGLRLVSAEFVARAAGYGKWVNVWTIDDPAEMRRLVDDKVGGIMTDRPDLLRDVLDDGANGGSPSRAPRARS